MTRNDSSADAANPNEPCPCEDRDMYFRYYVDQWTHVRHHESLRSALTLQVLISAGAVVAAFIQVGNSGLDPPLKNMLFVTLPIILIVIGIGGFTAVYRIEWAARSHIKRARAARKKLGRLETITREIRGFPDLQPLYLGFNVIVFLLGVAMLVAALINFIVP